MLALKTLMVVCCICSAVCDDAVPYEFRNAISTYFQNHDPGSTDLLARRLGLIDSTSGTSVYVQCVTSIIGTVGAVSTQGACANYLWNATANAVVSGGKTSSGWVAAANIDPIYNSYFPSNNAVPTPSASDLVAPAVQAPTFGYTAPKAYTMHQGLPLAAQVGWGGGPNVTLGSPSDMVVWGVHATPSTSALASGDASVLISWLMGGATYNAAVNGVIDYRLVCASGSAGCPLGALQNSPASSAFVPADVNFSVTVNVGTSSTSLTAASTTGLTCLQYLRVSNISDTGSNYLSRLGRATAIMRRIYKAKKRVSNYLSPYVCHVTVTNLKAATTYYYTLTSTVSGSPVVGPPVGTYKTPAMTTSASVSNYKFSTTSLASTGCPTSSSCANIYPVNWALAADVGQTFNSSLTAQYLATYLSNNSVQALLHVGDFTYGDNFGPLSTYQDGGSGVNPWKWDSWSRMWQPVLGQSQWLSAWGNHEIESLPGQAPNPAKYTDTSSSYGFLSSDQRYPYQAAATRFPNGGSATKSYGDSWSQSYYSQNLGPVHLIVMNSYIPFVNGTEQHNWLLSDITSVNRTAQPWLIVSFHVPVYHSYLTHYKEAECFRMTYESIFYQYKVDFVFSGHVHAYERTHPMYKYQPDNCGPAWFTMGDGGNIEGPYRNFVDEVIPNSNVTYCEATSGNLKSGVSMNGTWTPSYQLASQPPSCVTLSFEPAQAGTSAGKVVNPYDPSTFWCQSTQPAWSAYRDPSFGFGTLSLLSDTTATFSWYRNVDQSSVESSLQAADTATYARYSGLCPSPPSTTTNNTTPNAEATTAKAANPVASSTEPLAVAALHVILLCLFQCLM